MDEKESTKRRVGGEDERGQFASKGWTIIQGSGNGEDVAEAARWEGRTAKDAGEGSLPSSPAKSRENVGLAR